MTKYEALMAKYGHLIIEEHPMENSGLYADGCIWINEDLATDEKYCTLAEEIGHHMMTAGDILDQTDPRNRKQELIARRWAYCELVPREAIETAFCNGYTEPWEIAEYLSVDERFLRDALLYYGYLSA